MKMTAKMAAMKWDAVSIDVPINDRYMYVEGI